MQIHLKKRATALVVGGLSLGLCIGGGIAAADWNSTGSGSGTAKAITALALTTSDTSSSAVVALYPGAVNVGSLSIKLNNPNAYPVTITDIAQAGTITAAGGIGSCTVTGVSLAAITNATDTIAANSSAVFTHAGKVSMSNASDNGCQGATFTIPVSVTGHSG